MSSWYEIGDARPHMNNSDFNIVLDRAGADKYLNASDRLAIDMETTSKDIMDAHSIGMSVCSTPERGYYYPPADLEVLRPVLEDNNASKTIHNCKFDRAILKRCHGITVDNIWDTMVGGHLLPGLEALDRKSLSSLILNASTIDFDDLKARKLAPKDLNYPDLAHFSGPHAITALMLRDVFEPKLKSYRLDHIFNEVLMPLAPILSDMELYGTLIDVKYLAPLGTYFDDKITTIAAGMEHYSGGYKLNYNSPEQVSHLFFKVLKLPSKGIHATKGKKDAEGKLVPGISVNATDLQYLADKYPIVRLYLLYKKYHQLKSHFVTGLIKRLKYDGRLHTSFSQTRTRTGRLASSDPNLQNIPARTPEGRKVRAAFIAPEGFVIVVCDYSQIELRLMADFSQDPIMIAAYKNNEDLHTLTASFLFGAELAQQKLYRFIGKSANFQAGYGAGPDVMERKVREFAGSTAGIQGNGKQWLDTFWSRYEGLRKWVTATKRLAREAGQVTTLHGRIRVIDEYEELYRLHHETWLSQRGDREAVNTKIQGTAAEIIDLGMIKTHKQLQGSGARMLIQVHDEVVLEVPKHEVKDVVHVLRTCMPYKDKDRPLTLEYPVSIKVGPNWRDSVPIEELPGYDKQ